MLINLKSWFWQALFIKSNELSFVINLKINDNSGFLKLSRFQSKLFDGDDLIIYLWKWQNKFFTF